MPNVTDTAGNPLTQISLVLPESSESAVIVIRVVGVAGMFLTADATASAQVLARRTGSGAAFADIDAAPISLTPWAGQSVDFDVKISAGAVSGGIVRVGVPVRVTFNP